MDSLWFYRLFGEEFGPVDREALLSLQDSGMLGPDDEVRAEQSSQWQPLKLALAAPAAVTATSPTLSANGSPGDPDANWYYLLAGVEMGPLAIEDLIGLAEQGSLTADDEVKFGSTGKYRRVGSIGKLMSALPFQQSSIQITPTVKPTTASPGPGADPGQHPSSASVNGSSMGPLPSPPMVSTPTHHPAAEEPEWYAWIRGIEMGPVSLLQLAQWVKTGQLQSTDLVRSGKTGPWLPPTPTIEQSLSRLVMMAPGAPMPAPNAHSAPPPTPPVAMAPTAPPPTAAPPTATVPKPRIAAPPLVLPPPPAKTTQAPTAAEPPPAKPSTPSASHSAPESRSGAEPPKSATPMAAETAASGSRSSTVDTPPPSTRSTPATSTPTRPESPRPEPSRPAYSSGGLGSSGMSGGLSSGSPYGVGSMASVKAPPAKAAPKPKKSSGGGGGGISLGLGGLFEDKAQLAKVGGLLGVMLLFGIFYFMPPSTSDERAKYDNLQRMLTEFRQKRDAKASPAEWAQFVNESAKIAKDYQEEYRLKATSQFPIRQSIMFASQRFPQMLETAKEKTNGAEFEVDYHLKKAAFKLGLGEDPDKDLPPPTESTDPTMAPPT